MDRCPHCGESLTKRCTGCGETKPATEFHRRTLSKDGISYICKTCNIDRASGGRATARLKWADIAAQTAAEV